MLALRNWKVESPGQDVQLGKLGEVVGQRLGEAVAQSGFPF
jgi:hypothetical protein